MQKIKVCHLTTVHEQCDDRIFHKECKTLYAAGYDVTLIAKHDYDEIIDGIKIVALKKSQNRFQRMAGSTLSALFKALRQKADIYHFHDPELLLCGVLLKILTFKKVIYDSHEYFTNKLISKKWIKPVLRYPVAYSFRLIETLSCYFFDVIITADSFTKSKFNSNKTEVIANYPPFDFIDNVKTRFEHDKFRLIYAGGISEDRGIHVILEAMRILRGKNIEFILLGDIFDEQIISQIESYDNVKYFGSRPWREVSDYLLQADVGLVLLQPVPAYLYYTGENIIKLFEYMIAGLCVLISDFPELDRLVTKIGCGVSVDPTDPVKVAEILEYLSNNRSEVKLMGENGRRAVIEKYNWDSESQKLIGIYNKFQH